MKKLILILGLIPVIGFSQESNLGNWFMYLGNKKLNSNWNIHNEVQYRNYNVVGNMEQLLLRTGIGFNLSPNNNNILLGYGFIRSENYVSTDQKVGNEQRFLENDFKLRFRYFISVNVALSKPKIEKNTFYLSAYNEVFIQSKENLYDRNRVYAGLGYAINKDFRIELGYMNQLFNKGSRDQINIIGIINF
jgi:hypothetical protein